MPTGNTMSPSNVPEAYSTVPSLPLSCSPNVTSNHFVNPSSTPQDQLCNPHEQTLVCNTSSSGSIHVSIVPPECDQTCSPVQPSQVDEERLRVQTRNPCLVVSQYISPQGSPLLPSPVESVPSSESFTHSPCICLAPSMSATSLCSSRSHTLSPPSVVNGVVRSTSAYTYPNLQLPIPPRSPGLSPVTRISFSSEFGSSLGSSVSTPFGDSSHITDSSTTFLPSDVRLAMPSNQADAEEARQLQEGASGLLVSLNHISNVPGPPIYSPPPTYDQLCDPNALPSYLEATKYSSLPQRNSLKCFRGRELSPPSSSGGVFTLRPTGMSSFPSSVSFPRPYGNSEVYSSNNSALEATDNISGEGEGHREEGLSGDLAESEGGYSTILDAIPHDPALDTAPPVPIRFVPRCSLDRLKPPSIRLPCLNSACNKALVRQELNRRWPFILSAQEDDRCPGLLLVECSSNLTIARLPDPRSPPESPFDVNGTRPNERRFPSDGRGATRASRESRHFFPSDVRRSSARSRRSSDSRIPPGNSHFQRRNSTGGSVLSTELRRMSFFRRNSSVENNTTSPSSSPNRIVEESDDSRGVEFNHLISDRESDRSPNGISIVNGGNSTHSSIMRTFSYPTRSRLGSDTEGGSQVLYTCLPSAEEPASDDCGSTNIRSSQEASDANGPANIDLPNSDRSCLLTGRNDSNNNEGREDQRANENFRDFQTVSNRPQGNGSARSNPFANLSTTITGSVPSGIIAGGLAGSLAGLGVLDTSDLNNHVLFYLCGRCVSYDSFDADSVKVHIDLECPGMSSKWAAASEMYLVMRAAFFIALVLLVFVYFFVH